MLSPYNGNNTSKKEESDYIRLFFFILVSSLNYSCFTLIFSLISFLFHLKRTSHKGIIIPLIYFSYFYVTQSSTDGSAIFTVFGYDEMHII